MPVERIESWLKLVATAIGILAVIGPLVLRWWTRRKARKQVEVELVAAIAEATRRDVDALRWMLLQEYGDSAASGYLADMESRVRRAEILRNNIEQSRKRLWGALGMPESDSPSAPKLTTEEREALLAFRHELRSRALALTSEERQAFIKKHQK